MKTRLDGSFQFGSLSPGPVAVRVERPPAPWIAPPAVAVQAGDKNVRVTLLRGGSIRGRVLDPHGEPASDARVRWNGARGVTVQARCDADGRFELSPIAPDASGSVMASPSPNSDELLVPVSASDVRAGVSDFELRLSPGAMIRGTLAGPDGESVPNAWITLRHLEPGRRPG